MVLVALSYFGLQKGLLDFAFSDLYRYQLEKIQTQPRADIVLVGDSSLGNAIDAALLSERTGKSVVSLALTGAYGYGGTYNMLRRTLARWRPELIVIVQSPDMMRRAQVHEGFIHTAITASDLWYAPPKELLAVLANADMIASMARRAVKAHVPSNTIISQDYVRQSVPLSPELKRAASLGEVDTGSGLNRGQLFYLKKIAQACLAANIKCIYAHGPWIDALCNRSQIYVKEATSLIAQTGLAVLSEMPVCIPEQDVGDALDHISPSRKLHYTDVYLDKLVGAGAIKGRSSR